MHSAERVPGPVSYRPLFPEAADQGDPYLLAIPPGVPAAYRFYVYVTRDETSDGRGGTASAGAFPAFASNDLATWTPLGPSLQGDATRHAFWAPCVRYVPGLPRPYVMLYSHGAGTGEQAHIGHQIRRADAEQRKFTAGTTTTFFVFQAQRDLAVARNNELRAVLDYNLSIVDLETVQEAPLN